MLASLCFVTTSFAEGYLVRDGKAQADIVISKQPTRSVKVAAAEMQDILKRITGAELAIVTEPGANVPAHVYLGRSQYTDAMGITDKDLKSDAFRMLSDEKKLVLLGRDTDYVRREPYPRDNTPAEQERVQKELDKMTGSTWNMFIGSDDRRYNKILDIWAPDGKGSLNAVYEFLRGLGCRWYFPGECGEFLPKNKTVAIPKLDKTVRPDFSVRHLVFYYNEYFQASADELKWQLRLGLNSVPERKSAHGLMIVHGRKEFKEAHPEYYALWNGKRATEHDRWGAPCLSSEGLFNETVKYVRAQYDIYDAKVVSVGPCDSYFMLCQCDLCKGKDAPERGWDGQLSDYVWDFVNRVAKEVYKTHPDRLVSCVAYSAYQLTPLKIDKLSPNVAVIICQARYGFHNPETRKRFENMVQAWTDKTPSGELSIFEYYLAGWPGRNDYDGVPVYYPRMIAQNLRFLKGKSKGDAIEVYRSRKKADTDLRDILYVSHLNIYTTARLYWNADLDVDALLEEYYSLHYGPAAREMKAFIEYSEANWPQMVKRPEPIDKATELLAAARKAAGDTIYGKRIEGVVEYIAPLKAVREKVAVGRTNAPVAFAPDLSGKVVLDGKLDEAFWKDAPKYELKNMVTGEPPANKTSFQTVWDGNAIVFGVRCEDADMKSLRMSATKDEDANIFNDDAVELLLETGARSYYQIVVNPAGYMADIDRANRVDTKWTSSATATAFRGDNYWSVEVRVPVAGPNAATIDPLNGLAGEKPTEDAPWYFNVCRQRKREVNPEMSGFSHTGKTSFHVPMKFGKLVVK